MLDICLLGTGGMMPLPYRWLTSMMARCNGSSLLIDCGEGTQIALREKGWSPRSIDVICFTHYHADHISGLPGLLLTMGNAERHEPLLMIGPKGLERVVTAPRIGRFDAARAKEQGIPLKFWNPLQKGQTITDGDKVYTPDMVLGEARRGLKVSYCTDTRPVPAIAEYAKDADLMICEGMYGEPDKQQKAREHKHMTMQEAAKLAAEAKPKELWLTHYSPSLNYPEEFMEGIRKIFPAAKAAKDGWTMELDFPEEA